jgi:hypothetical protein
LVLSMALTVFGRSQSITFVHVQIPNVREASPTSTQDSERYVRNLSALCATVLEINRVSIHQPLDFVVMSGNTESMPQDPKVAADVLVRLLGGLSPNTVLFALDVPRSLNGQWPTVFFTELNSRLSNKKIVDLRSQPMLLHGINLADVNSVAMMSKQSAERDSELKRLAAILSTGPPAVFFATSTAPSASVMSGSLWPLAGAEKTNMSALLQNPKLLAAFVSVGQPASTLYPTLATQKTETGFLGERHIIYILPSLEEPYDQPGASHGIMLISLSPQGRVETRPISLFNRFSEEPRDLQDALIQAEVNEKDEEYATAYKLYADALKSKDTEIRSSAEAGLHRMDAKLQGYWERLQRDSVVVGWITKHWADISFAVPLIAAVLFWMGFRYRGRALPVFRAPKKLSDDAPAELFVLCIYRQMLEIRDTWRTAQNPKNSDLVFSDVSLVEEGLDVDTALSLGEDIPEKMLDELPKLVGENPASALKLVFFFWRFFSWHVESSVYGTEENAAVYVRVCWGWKTKATWALPAVGGEPMGIRECAAEIAYNISSEALLKR